MSPQDDFEQLIKDLISPSQKEKVKEIYSNPPARNTQINLTKNAKEIFNRRYRRKDADGNFVESIHEAYQRVASCVAAAEEMPEAVYYFTNVFYNLLTRLELIPNAPTWTGAGTPLGQLAACFVLPIEDDMGSHPDGIFSTLKNAALIQQTGGGNGFSFSRIRPKNDVVKASMGKASGPIGFLEVYDAAFAEIAQGGVRRGANMAVLRVDHPDIREFIKCKSQEGKIKNFNISVAITDQFMEAVKKDLEFKLRNPRDNQVWEKVQAKELFEMMVEYAHRNGEPGVLFIDEANRYNPVPNQYPLEATNPCGEQWLGPYENCCLGHVNLAVHVSKDSAGWQIDWGHLAQTVKNSTRFLDNVVTVNSYVEAVPQLKEKAHLNRRIGLGFTGLADVMYKLGIRYGSEKAVELATQLTEFIRYHSLLTSIGLAQEKGAFPGISGSIYDFANLSWVPPTPLKPYTQDWNRPKLDWNLLVDQIKQFGMRNATQMTVAPTGSTSTVLGVEGYGCEPVFALAYFRNVYQAAGKDESLTLKYISPLFQAKLDQLDLSTGQKEKIINEIIEKGTCQHIEELPKDFRDTFVVSADITPKQHVLMQGSIQRFVDNSISKTCNFPEKASQEDIWKVYFQAWELGLKGLTIYRTGSRKEIVLETKETKEAKIKEEQDDLRVRYVVRPREKVLTGETHKVSTPLGNMYITINRNKDGGYHEMFINLGNAGSDLQADTEAIGKLISLIFRLGSADSKQRMKAIIHELEGISSGMVTAFNGDRVLSIPDAIAKALQRVDNPDAYAQQEELKLFNQHNPLVNPNNYTEMCPYCGNYSVLMVEGCKKCTQQLGGCGEYSAC